MVARVDVCDPHSQCSGVQEVVVRKVQLQACHENILVLFVLIESVCDMPPH